MPLFISHSAVVHNWWLVDNLVAWLILGRRLELWGYLSVQYLLGRVWDWVRLGITIVHLLIIWGPVVQSLFLLVALFEFFMVALIGVFMVALIGVFWVSLGGCWQVPRVDLPCPYSSLGLSAFLTIRRVNRGLSIGLPIVPRLQSSLEKQTTLRVGFWWEGGTRWRSHGVCRAKSAFGLWRGSCRVDGVS